MTDVSPAPDPFAAARANLRDTVKWLIAALAALAAAILAGSPLTSFGTLGPGWRLYMAIAAGSIGMMLVFAAIYIAFRLLVWRPFFLSDLAADRDLSSFIDEHAADLLPPEIPHFAEFLEQRAKARAVLQKTAGESDSADRLSAAQTVADSELVVERLLGLAYFEHLRRKLIRSGGILFALALCAVVALGAFAWAANPLGKTSEAGRSVSFFKHTTLNESA